MWFQNGMDTHWSIGGTLRHLTILGFQVINYHQINCMAMPKMKNQSGKFQTNGLSSHSNSMNGCWNGTISLTVKVDPFFSLLVSNVFDYGPTCNYYEPIPVKSEHLAQNTIQVRSIQFVLNQHLSLWNHLKLAKRVENAKINLRHQEWSNALDFRLKFLVNWFSKNNFRDDFWLFSLNIQPEIKTT